MMVAEIRNVDGAFELVGVTIEPEGTEGSAPNRYIVKRAEGLTCPVCWANGSEVVDQWVRPGVAQGSVLSGLDPENCAACHDTYTRHGIAPMTFHADGSPPTAIPRPA